jgi:transposase
MILSCEWSIDDLVAVREREAREDGIEKGREDERERTARTALREGFSVEVVQKITGLDTKTITSLSEK